MTQSNADLPLVKDLTTDVPRSPRDTLGGYVIAARALDKCRAVLAETAGEYHFNCPLDKIFFEFTGIDADAFKAEVAKGTDDSGMEAWIRDQAKEREREDVVQWNNDLRYKRISEMPANLQVFLEDYIAEHVAPKGKPVYVWFDVYDIEEGRI
ncbi:MAG: DUF5069 domain-containing protein [Opitutales bacterium]